MAAPWTYGAEVRIIGEIHGSVTNNVVHFATNTDIQDSPDPVGELLLQLATAMMRCVVDTLLPALSEDWSFTGVEARAIHPTTSDPVFVAADAGSIGGQGPTNVSFAAMLVSIRTGKGGRNGRGRMYLPPASDQVINASVLDGPTLILIAAFLNCLLDKFMGSGDTWRLGVLSRKQLKAAGGTFDGAFREAIGLTPRPVVATMVSRKKGRGI